MFRAQHIHEGIMKSPLSMVVIIGKRSKEACEATCVVDINKHEGKTLQGAKFDPLTMINMKVLSSVPNGEFKFVQLEDNPIRSVKIWVDLLDKVKKGLVEFLRDNNDLFNVSPYKMWGHKPLCIMSLVECQS